MYGDLSRRQFIKKAGLGTILFTVPLWMRSRRCFGGKKDLPSPGKWTLCPDKLVSGQEVELELRYENGNNPLPAGSYHRVLIEPLSIKTLFHCPPSTDLKVVKYKGQLPEVKLDPKPVHGVGFREVRMLFPKGLEPRQSFAVQIGNKQKHGSIKALVDPIPVENLTFEIYSNLKGDAKEKAVNGDGYTDPWNKTEYKELDWQRMGWINNLPRVEVLGDKASSLRVFGPSLIQTDQEFSLKISVTDDFDNRATPAYNGTVVIEYLDSVLGLPKRLKYTTRDKCSKTIDGLKITRPGVYRIKVKLSNGNKWFESNPIVVRGNVDAPIYWGNIHNHCQYSEDWGTDLDTFYTFARDVSGMDFVALSDHRGEKPVAGRGVGRLLRWRKGHSDSLEAWKDTINKSTEYNDQGKFVTLYGYEWSSMDMGHYNIYVPEARLEDIDQYFTDRYTDYGFVMRELLKDTEALFIPHVHADMLPYYNLVGMNNSAGKPMTPVVEVYSDWGDAYFPYGQFDQHSKFGAARNEQTESYLWAIDKGYKIGAIGDSDAHTGLPGKRTPGGLAPNHDHPQGLTAAMTNDYSRRGIMDAYHQRHVYGTTGERIFLDVKALDASMGDELRTDVKFKIDIEIAGTDQIEAIWLYRGSEKIAEHKPINKREIYWTVRDIVPTDIEAAYVVTAIQKNGNMLYGTPIWVRKASIAKLDFEKTEDEVYLINNGFETAYNINVFYAKDEHPFAMPEIKGRECKWKESAGMVWTERQGENRTMLHYRWHGEPISAKIKIIGSENYDIDFNRDLFFMKKRFADNGKGTITFQTGKMVTVTHSQGLDILIESSISEKCEVIIEYEQKLKTIVGDNDIVSKQVVIPLNNIKDGNFSVNHMRKLDVGESVQIGKEQGYYSIVYNTSEKGTRVMEKYLLENN